MNLWEQSLYTLLASASVDIPADVEEALRRARALEAHDSNAARALDTILANIRRARERQRPLCQDTGTVLFWVALPQGVRQSTFRTAAEAAVARATENGFLRQNSVETLTGRNTGNNLGAGHPVIHWEENERETGSVALLLKGGGCENVGAQYALPNTDLGAARSLDGVRRCVLDAVCRAQGRGCAPGVLGVAIGGDRATGYDESKRLLLRRIGERSDDAELAELETRLLSEANSLGIGPMGFGGQTTLLDVFIGCLNRLPASYFVTVSYMCWAYRRKQVRVAPDGSAIDWS